jgi:ribosomal subunit interface protein
MLVQVTTDNHLTGSEKLNAYAESALNDALARYGDQVTRVGVHLADENSHKKGDADKRCTLEARLKGLEPIVATGSGGDVDQAIDQAIDKLLSALDKKVGRLGDKKGRASFAGD